MVEVKLSFASVDEMLAYFVEQRMVAQSMPPIISASVVEEGTKNVAKRTRAKTKEESAEIGKPVEAAAPAPEPTPEPAVEDAPAPNESPVSSAEAKDSAPTEASPTPAPAAPAPSASSVVPQPEVTVEVIRAYATTRMREDAAFQTKMVDTIKSFGADKLSGVAKDKLADLLEKLKEL